ncbi:MAG: HAD-IIA family hydrolase [Thermomicrobiales bacterium]
MAEQQAPEWIDEVDAYIIDMDGVLYRGSQAIPEARPFLEALDARGIPYMMATNNATQTPANYVAKLEGMGIHLRNEQIFTSALATGDYLRATYERGTTVYVVGMSALREAVYGDGYFEEAGTDADLVVSGADFELQYETLRIACLAIRNGADYVATNADVTFPTPEGLVPGSGAIVAALVASGDKEPVVVGKPSPVMVERSLSQLGTEAERTVMLGDRLDTDILAGQRAGTRTVLVTTGISTVEDIESTGIEPDWTIETLDILISALERRGG